MKKNQKYLNWKKTFISKNASIEKVIKNLNETALQIALVVNKRKLIGTITDGDIRRGLIKGLNKSDKISSIINKRPITSIIQNSTKFDYNLMKKHKINSLPKIDKKGNVVGLLTSLMNPKNKFIENKLIFMVGGKGKRLMPLTKTIPKPMIKIKGKPILEILIEKARDEGFTNIQLMAGYLGKKIKKYFNNGKDFGVNIDYYFEKKPLGTAGSLSFLKTQSKIPVIVANGDLITQVKYSDILNYHIKQKNDATIVVKKHEIMNPYGVVKILRNKVVDLTEKPSSSSYVSAGIYVFNPVLFKNIKRNKYLDMTTLLNLLIEKRYRINAYPLHENWIDIGLHSHLKIAKRKQ